MTLFSLLPLFILTLFITFPVWRRHLKTKSHRKEKKNPNKKDWGSWLVHGPGSEFNRTFYGSVSTLILTWNSKGKSVDTTGKRAFKLVKLSSLKVVRVKREKI